MSRLQDVATLAGFSKATISRVINNSQSVSASTQKKVMDALATLNINANELKRSVEGTMMIGLVLPLQKNISSYSFGMDIIAGAEEMAFDKDYMILLGNSSGKEKENKLSAQMLNRDVEGIIMLSTSNQLSKDHLHFVQQSGTPLVLVDQKIDGFSAHYVRGDNLLGSMTLVNYLLSLGHRNIAILSPAGHTTYSDRIKGYQFALMEKGITVPGNYQIISNDRRSFPDLIRALLNSESRPSAVFLTDPGSLSALIDIAGELNLNIPADLNVVVFDDIYTHLPDSYQNFFTSVTQSGKQIGRMAVDLLFQQIKNPDLEPQEIVLPGTVNIRQSTCAVNMN
ncbi:MAG: hypothetical protein JWN30_1768 [Bacilli bacterium]|nr:hypothetical protein [Bacilli bacterium]